MASLQSLDLSVNDLAGEIPASLVKLANLRLLNLFRNHLRGGIPVFVADLSELEVLQLWENNLTGPLASELGQLRNLSRLNVSGNSLTGAIRSELTRCALLAAIDASRNRLMGEIPEGVTSLKILCTVNMSRNALSGELLPGMSNMTSLTTLDVSYNALSGAGAGVLSLRHWDSKKMLVCLAAVFGALVAAFLGRRKGCGAWCEAARRRSGAWKMTVFQKLDFSADDVVECLKEDNIIGKGGAGIVYHGVTHTGAELAIKRLVGRGVGGDRGFSAEVGTPGRIRHRNVGSAGVVPTRCST